MKQIKQKGSSMGTGIGVGGSSILAVFVVLCLTTFAVLSLVSAGADLRLSKKSAESVTLYYEADVKGQTLLDTLYNLSDESLSKLITNPEKLQYITSCQAQDESILIHFSIPMNEFSSLKGEALVFPTTHRNIMELKDYHVEVTEASKSDATVEIWDGTLPS